VNLAAEEDQGLKVTWRNQPIVRILLTLRAPVASGRFQYRVSVI
jgi:hypothetical protein